MQTAGSPHLRITAVGGSPHGSRCAPPNPPPRACRGGGSTASQGVKQRKAVERGRARLSARCLDRAQECGFREHLAGPPTPRRLPDFREDLQEDAWEVERTHVSGPTVNLPGRLLRGAWLWVLRSRAPPRTWLGLRKTRRVCGVPAGNISGSNVAPCPRAGSREPLSLWCATRPCTRRPAHTPTER